MWRLLNGAMPLSANVKQVVLQIGSNNLLKQWFQVSLAQLCRTLFLSDATCYIVYTRRLHVKHATCWLVSAHAY